MKIINIFKRQKDARLNVNTLHAGATLYPDKILIETIDRVKEGFGISSTNISILPLDTDKNVLGSTIRHHLNLTRFGLAIPKEYKKHYQDFLDKAGFKNGKEHHKNALYLTIVLKQNQIIIGPTKNGGHTGKDRGFLGVKGADIVVNADIDNSVLGDKIKEGWSKCE
ncbi:MAG: hypothetical protein DI539_21810 [Flavobacterium psychrophilum]|nr:MAG: hypothetical protein DI539_21810 [Flavobacterium psychrophilum]